MHRKQKLTGIEGSQREWPEPAIHRLDIQLGEARLHRVRMNSTPYLTTLAIMMQGAKDTLVTPNRMHLRKIEFLTLLLPSRHPRTFSKCLVLMLRPPLPEMFIDNELSFLA